MHETCEIDYYDIFVSWRIYIVYVFIYICTKGINAGRQF